MKICLKNIGLKLFGIIVGTWWILLAMGMIHITKISPDVNWLVACGLVGGWILVGFIGIISLVIGLMLVMKEINEWI